MAKPQRQQNQAPVSNDSDPPAGMIRVGSVANAPWWDIKDGNVLKGKLINVFSRPDERSKTGKSKFFQIELTSATDVRYGRGKDAAPGRAEAGAVVNLNHGPKTKDLENYIPDILQGAEYLVWVKVDGPKFDIGRGQTMWPLDVRAKQTVAPSASSEPDFADGEDSGDSEEAAS